MALLGLCLCAGLGWAVWALHVEEVRVIGARGISANEIVEVAAVDDERILWMRTSVVSRRLEALPGVAAAVVERRLPSTIVITVTEREPVVRLEGRPALVADEDGVVFGTPGDASLPVLAGWSGSPELGSRLPDPAPAVLAALDDFPPALRERIVRVDLGRPAAMLMVLDDGIEVRFGRPSDLLAKAAAAQAVLEVAAQRGQELAYVDVRAPGVPVSRRRDPPTPEPTPVPTPAPEPPPAPEPTPAPEPDGAP